MYTLNSIGVFLNFDKVINNLIIINDFYASMNSILLCTHNYKNTTASSDILLFHNTCKRY